MSVLLVLMTVLGCDPGEPTPDETATTEEQSPQADVVDILVTGTPGAYTFAVTLESDDLGCQQYADWWEVLGEDGRLVYRRILNHSHPSEQPFTRQGGPVAVAADQVVVVRGHMSPDGYGGRVMRGVAGGYFAEATDLPEGWAAAVATEPPLPEGCWY